LPRRATNPKTIARNKEKRKNLKKMVTQIRSALLGKRPIDLDKYKSGLAALGKSYTYKTTQYPDFELPSDLKHRTSDTPTNLAEAFIWKTTFWNKYGKFVDAYKNGGPPQGDYITFWAYAMYLRNPDLPIFDQHALRAVWALSSTVKVSDLSNLREFLLAGDSWELYAKGSTAKKCYDYFVRRVGSLAGDRLDIREFDKVLMPLGKALKDFSTNGRGAYSSDYASFCEICSRTRKWTPRK
jgi:hypothetical protein